jgi:hypothetical protein
MKPERLYGKFGHVPTGISIPIDTLELYFITYIYIIPDFKEVGS